MKTRPIRSLAAALMLASFLLGIRDGYMALWKNDDPEPVHIFSFRAAVLPEEIRNALEHGICVEEGSDVGRLLQEMIS